MQSIYNLIKIKILVAGLKDISDVLTGAVERVKKIRDYAFVHFSQREDAIAAMNALNGKVE